MHRHLSIFVVAVFGTAFLIFFVLAIAGQFSTSENNLQDHHEQQQKQPINESIASILVSSVPSDNGGEGESYDVDFVSGNGEKMTQLDNWIPPQHFVTDYRFYQAGDDLEDRPIFIVELGKWDLSKLLEEGEDKLFEKYLVQQMRRTTRIISEMRTPENPVSGALVIIDMADFVMSQLLSVSTTKFFIHLIRTYHQLLGFIEIGFMVNTNAVAYTGIKMVKPIIQKFMQRLEVYGTNKVKWIPKLLRFCDRSQIPEAYGGTWKKLDKKLKFLP